MATGRVVEEIREELECPVCFMVPKSGPIYQCEVGHIHCNKCHPKLRECPICRGPIGNTRSLMTEKIIAKLPIKCSFIEHGCQEDEKLPKDILLHEKSCEFRLVKCLISRCKEDISVSDFVNHFTRKHQCKIQEANQCYSCVRVPKTSLQDVTGKRLGFQSIPWFIKAPPSQKFAIYIRGDKCGHISFYLFIIGSQCDIDDGEYKCKFEIKNHHSLRVSNQKYHVF